MRIRNWNKFQHYKHRKPPWIRLYRELLEDPDWMNQEDEGKALLCELWMVASDTDDGSLPAIEALAWRLRRSIDSIKIGLSTINDKFLDGASEVLAECEQDAPSEKRRVTEQSRGELQRQSGVASTDESIDQLDADIAFEESRFNSLALSIGRDRIQSVLDSLPRPKSVGAFSASRWLATGRSGIGRDERAMTRLKLTNDGLEAWKREVESPSGRKKGPAPAWDRGIAHDVPDEVILAWDPRLGPKPDSLREPAITRQTQTQEMPS